MSKLEQLLEGVEVEWKTLGEVTEITRGKRLVKSQLEETGEYTRLGKRPSASPGQVTAFQDGIRITHKKFPALTARQDTRIEADPVTNIW
jgi:hypothetical protein